MTDITSPDASLFSEATVTRAASTHATQWRAQTFQMVNWGGFSGHKAVDLSPDSTLITGASGTGKSTLLDAYLALMMPSDTPFNAASNDAVTGKARSGESRSVLTYLRGKMDATADAGTGRLKDVVLRPGTQWGGIAMTFVDDHGRQYTALRIYRVPATATAYRDITKQLGTFDGYLDLRAFVEIADSKFDKRTIKTHIPGIKLADGPEDFAATLFARLGIGANGNGTMAIRLLARVQAGMPVPSVDRLYKQMVLERPSTYDKATVAIRHFEDLGASYQEMKQEAAKQEVLARIPNLYDDCTTAQDTIDQIDTFKHDREGDTPFHLWRLRYQRDLLDRAEENLAERLRAAREDKQTAEREEAELKAQIAQNEAEQRSNGQETLDRLEADIGLLTIRIGETERAAVKFAEATSHVVGPAPTSRDGFTQLQQRATAFINDYLARAETARDERDRLRDIEGPLGDRLGDLVEEQKVLAKRTGLVPPRLDMLREAVSEASGIPVEDLPFVAELLDVHPSEEAAWRKAIEVSLFAPARVMLVIEDDLDHLSASIDRLRLPSRLNFEGVPHRPHADVTYDPDRVSGKVIFKDSPFSHWVQQRVRKPDVDALCVRSTADLHGPGLRVLASGQTRRERRGAHGDLGDRNIIGFSNEARRAEVAADIATIRGQIDEVRAQIRGVEKNDAGLREQHAAHLTVVNTRFDDIDINGVAEKLASRKAEREAILDDNEPLRALKEAHAVLDERRDDAAARRHTTNTLISQLEPEQVQVIDLKDMLWDEVERIENAQQVILDDPQTAYLHALYEETATDPENYAQFASTAKKMKTRLSERSNTARRERGTAETALTDKFVEYQRTWRDDTLGGTGIDAYDNYLRVLERIRATGLHEKQEEWSRRMAKWSSEDLVPLDGAFREAFMEIENRLLPVNNVLASLPFSPKNYRLKMKMRVRTSDDFERFRDVLRTLASGTASLATRDDLEQQFARLDEFMKRIQEPKNGGSTTSRDHLLDIRQHIEITAVALDDTDTERAVYATLGGKSGGESQELVAFIVGAALRFQLGDEERDRPRFAPVFLDEGFVKSDSEFANRAVHAWKKLGFQLIVGAPVDKVRALLPSMDQALLVTKNTNGYSHISTITETTIRKAAQTAAAETNGLRT